MLLQANASPDHRTAAGDGAGGLRTLSSPNFLSQEADRFWILDPVGRRGIFKQTNFFRGGAVFLDAYFELNCKVCQFTALGFTQITHFVSRRRQSSTHTTIFIIDKSRVLSISRPKLSSVYLCHCLSGKIARVRVSQELS